MDKLVRDKLARLPKPANSALRSLRFKNVKTAFIDGKKTAKKIKLYNIMNILKNEAKGLLTAEMEGILTEYLQEN